jgi:hypothetical protein
MACTSAQAPSRRGKLRSHLCADRGFSCFHEAGKSQQDVSSALITFGIREGKCEEVSQFRGGLMFVDAFAGSYLRPEAPLQPACSNK